MNDSILNSNKKIITPNTRKSAFSNDENSFTSLSMSALLAKSEVPLSHKKAANNYIIIKRIYKFQVLQTRISHQELAHLKSWANSQSRELREDADTIMQIRVKELKNISSNKYAQYSNEVYDGYRALERYFEEISKF